MSMRIFLCAVALLLAYTTAFSQHIMSDVTPLKGQEVVSVSSIATAGDDTVFVLTGNGRFFFSADAGESWSERTMPDVSKGSADMRHLWLFRSSSGTLIAIASYFGYRKEQAVDSGHVTILTSDNDGASWTTRIDTSGPRLYDASLSADGVIAVSHLFFDGGSSPGNRAYTAVVDPTTAGWTGIEWASSSRMVSFDAQRDLVMTHVDFDSTGMPAAMWLIRSQQPYAQPDTVAELPISVSVASKPWLTPDGSVFLHRHPKAFRWDAVTGDTAAVTLPLSLTDPRCAQDTPPFSCSSIPGTSLLIYPGPLCEDLVLSNDQGRTWTTSNVQRMFSPCCGELSWSVHVSSARRAWMLTGYYNDAWEWVSRMVRIDLDQNVVSVREPVATYPQEPVAIERYDLMGRRVDEPYTGLCFEVSVTTTGERVVRGVLIEP